MAGEQENYIFATRCADADLALPSPSFVEVATPICLSGDKDRFSHHECSAAL